MHLIVRYLVIEGMDTDGRQIGNLIEVRIISLALMTIELQPRQILIGTSRLDETNIAKAS